MSRVVFLDIDGVIVLAGKGPVNSCIQQLNRVCRDGKTSLVVSSTWRRAGLAYIRGRLTEMGVTATVRGCTPDLGHGHLGGRLWIATDRGTEIAEWLRNHPTVTSYVILDDDDDMDGLKDHLVQTDPYQGLTARDAERAINLLKHQHSDGRPMWATKR